LAVELYSHGLTADVIADKLELPVGVVEGWIKSGPGRPRTVDGIVLSALGDDELSAERVACLTKINPHNVSTYLLRMWNSGVLLRRQISRADGRKIFVYRKKSPTPRHDSL
jgi:hypothetical protein